MATVLGGDGRHRRHLRQIVERALDAVSGRRLVSEAFGQIEAHVAPALASGRLSVIAAGKVAVPMVESWIDASRARVAEGIVAAPVGHPPDADLEFYRVGHPVPSVTSVAAGSRALSCARAVPPDGVLLVLLSGGASASIAVPIAPLTLEDKVAAAQALLRSGEAIDAVNCVRKHLSAIKGGRLAAASGGTVVTLAISDVVGPVPDDPAVIGSGPTVGDPTTFADAMAVINRSSTRAAFPGAARQVIVEGCRGRRPETPKPGDEAVSRSRVHVIGSRREAMEGAGRAARELGYAVSIVERAVVGEARVAARGHVSTVMRLAAGLPRPACLISSGETTVEVRGAGRGGRNQEFALASVRGFATSGEVMTLASVGTDGVDGPTDAAGAYVDSSTLERGKRRGLGPPETFLDRNDSYAFFDTMGDLLRTGPTDTNVGDLQVVLIDHADS